MPCMYVYTEERMNPQSHMYMCAPVHNINSTQLNSKPSPPLHSPSGPIRLIMGALVPLSRYSARRYQTPARAARTRRWRNTAGSAATASIPGTRGAQNQGAGDARSRTARRVVVAVGGGALRPACTYSRPISAASVMGRRRETTQRCHR